jgi:purine-nucleoside phosphorylase
MKMTEINVAVARLRQLSRLEPRFAIVLGSGFQGALQDVKNGGEASYEEVGFPCVSVRGHVGRLVIGTMERVPVLAMFGRAHYYEGFSMAEVTFPVRVLAQFGIRDLLLTNAAGGINRRYREGDFVILKDHINSMGVNPLRGEQEERFVDLSRVYDPDLRKTLRQAGKAAGVRVHEGVYVAVSGPSYETPAEIRAFRKLGADLVGMSTVPEAIVARQCGLRVAGLSCVTNLAAGLSAKPLSHEEVLATGKKVQQTAADLLGKFVSLYAKTQ